MIAIPLPRSPDLANIIKCSFTVNPHASPSWKCVFTLTLRRVSKAPVMTRKHNHGALSPFSLGAGLLDYEDGRDQKIRSYREFVKNVSLRHSSCFSLSASCVQAAQSAASPPASLCAHTCANAQQLCIVLKTGNYVSLLRPLREFISTSCLLPPPKIYMYL